MVGKPDNEPQLPLVTASTSCFPVTRAESNRASIHFLERDFCPASRDSCLRVALHHQLPLDNFVGAIEVLTLREETHPVQQLSKTELTPEHVKSGIHPEPTHSI